VKSLDDSCWAKVVIQRMQTCKNARKNVLVFLLYKELKNMYSIKICQTEKKKVDALQNLLYNLHKSWMLGGKFEGGCLMFYEQLNIL
jgi:hypothetical protein